MNGRTSQFPSYSTVFALNGAGLNGALTTVGYLTNTTNILYGYFNIPLRGLLDRADDRMDTVLPPLPL